jgi:hypothetical protein
VEASVLLHPPSYFVPLCVSDFKDLSKESSRVAFEGINQL